MDWIDLKDENGRPYPEPLQRAIRKKIKTDAYQILLSGEPGHEFWNAMVTFTVTPAPHLKETLEVKAGLNVHAAEDER